MKNAKKTRTTDEILMGSSRKRRAFEVFNYLLLTCMAYIDEILQRAGKRGGRSGEASAS